MDTTISKRRVSANTEAVLRTIEVGSDFYGAISEAFYCLYGENEHGDKMIEELFLPQWENVQKVIADLLYMSVTDNMGYRGSDKI